MSFEKRVCIIGAGKAGLCALRHSLAHNLSAVAYERMKSIGGTWVPMKINNNDNDNDDGNNDDIDDGDDDEYTNGCIYEGLRTNLPKEVMGFPDFLYPDTKEASFLDASEVLEFIELYAENFQLKSHIKFQTEVIRLRPKNNLWEVIVRDLRTNNYEMNFFDFVFVCNGHYSAPLFPKITGMNIFKGKQLHSHKYRKAEKFKDEVILIIGCGPSGIDIVHQLQTIAKKIYFSLHLKPSPDLSYMSNITIKPDVSEFTENGVVFEDGSKEYVTVIIYCTGYKYEFPFLSVDCGVNVEENFVQPLYKHCININYPTMCFIGLPCKILPTQIFDIQVRFALKFYTNQKKMPDSEEMLADLKSDINERRKRGLSKQKWHLLGEKQFDYCRDLAEIADIETIAPVVEKIMRFCQGHGIYNPVKYRQICFKVIDDQNYVKYTQKN